MISVFKSIFYGGGLFLACVWLSSCCEPLYRHFLVEELPPAQERMLIPRKIHQVWHVWKPDKPEPSAQHKKWIEELKENHPGWEYILWTDKDSRELIRKHYAWFLPVYDGYDEPVKRADAIRYFILDRFGGVYVDMGFQNLKNLEPLLRGAQFVAGEQDDVQIFSVANGFMASIAQHPLWPQVMAQLAWNQSRHVLRATGPAFFTRVISEYLEQQKGEGFKIYHKKFLYPYPWYDKYSEKAKKCRMDSRICAAIFPDAFMAESWGGSWKD